MKTFFLTILATIGFFAIAETVFAADNQCGSRTCEEAICATAPVLVCSDWNDGGFDGWAISSGGKDGTAGAILEGVGYKGTTGWRHIVKPRKASSVFYGKTFGTYNGPLYSRYMTKFSKGFQFWQRCGLNKMYYHKRDMNRLMLGMDSWDKIEEGGGTLAGVVGFDYYGHLVELPNGKTRSPDVKIIGTDIPMKIVSDRWYTIEWMTEVTSKGRVIVVIWINGKRQMGRETSVEYARLRYEPWTRVQQTDWAGGGDGCTMNESTQYIYRDNTVISKQPIGPVGSTTSTALIDPEAPRGATVF